MQAGSIALHAKYAYLTEKLERAIRYLKTADFSAMQKGDLIDIEDGMFVRVQQYTTAPASTRRFESHRRHFDVQYMVEGQELFGCLEGNLPPDGAYDEQADMQFHLEPERSNTIVFRQGDYIIVSPEEPHKPNCALGEPAAVKKVVVKIRV